MTNALFTPATAPQISFLRDLLAKREVDTLSRTTLEAKLGTATLTKVEASNAITTLKASPFAKKAPVFEADDPRKAVLAVLETIPHGSFAIPTEEVNMALTHTNVQGNDLLFIAVSEFRGTLYMRRLHGAPGGFTRSRVSISDALTIARVIASDPTRYGKIFADHYSICARCHAELTDETSRDLGYGPTCRKAYGL